MRRLLLALMLPVLVTAQPLRQLFGEFYEDYLRLNPESATVLGRADYDDRWTDWSAAGRKQRAELAEKYVARLKAVTLDGLDERERINAEIFRHGLEQEIEHERLGLDGLLRVSQLYGAHTAVYNCETQKPVKPQTFVLD